MIKPNFTAQKFLNPQLSSIDYSKNKSKINNSYFRYRLTDISYIIHTCRMRHIEVFNTMVNGYYLKDLTGFCFDLHQQTQFWNFRSLLHKHQNYENKETSIILRNSTNLFIFTSNGCVCAVYRTCGPMGPQGYDGQDGLDGINYTSSVIYDVDPSEWIGDVDGYNISLNIPEITDEIYYNRSSIGLQVD